MTITFVNRSDPASPMYGKPYTMEQIHSLFAPHNDSVSTVTDWLKSANIASERISQSVNKQWLQFDASVEELEGLVNSSYHLYEHLQTGQANVACSE